MAVLQLALSVTQPDGVRVGDPVTVTAKQAFTRGARWSFFVGGEYAAWSRIDDHTAVVVVPAGSTGKQRLAAARALTTDASDAVPIAPLTLQDIRSEVIATSTGTLRTKPAELAIGSFVSVRARAVGREAAMTMRRIRSDVENAFVRTELVNAALPPQSLDDVLVLHATAAIDADRIRVKVPASFSPPAGFAPELYTGIVDRGGHGERIAGLDSLHAHWDPVTRFLTSSIDPPLRLARGQEQTVYVAIRRTANH